MSRTYGYAVLDAHSALVPFAFDRREPGPGDVEIEVLYCGICHTDLHQIRNHWGSAIYPMVPGHEVVGRVTRIGSAVTRFAAGDVAGVGCIVESCRACSACQGDLEGYCEQGPTYTYNDKSKRTGEATLGGYAKTIVVDEHFVFRIPAGLDLKGVGPLLCAGITTYSPLRHWKVGPGSKVGIIGLGGLGHLGIKFAKALGARVVLITSSSAKKKDALRLGADEVLVSRDAEAMSTHLRSFDFLLDTIPASHDLSPYVGLLKLDGTLTLVGAVGPIEPIVGAYLMMARRSIAGSSNGGIAETQEMLEFCARHGIVSDVEVVPASGINEALDRLERNDVRYRFVIDMSTLASG